MSFSCLLAVLFIGLKLCEVITWSWVWVLSPLWLGGVVTLIVFVAAVILKTKYDKY